MSFLVPELFRNVVTAPFSDKPQEKTLEAITTIALGVLIASSSHFARGIPFAGLAIMIGSFSIDLAGAKCAIALSESYDICKLSNIVYDFIKAGQSVPLQITIPLILSIGIAWYFFNQAGKPTSGWLRSN